MPFCFVAERLFKTLERANDIRPYNDAEGVIDTMRFSAYGKTSYAFLFCRRGIIKNVGTGE